MVPANISAQLNSPSNTASLKIEIIHTNTTPINGNTIIEGFIIYSDNIAIIVKQADINPPNRKCNTLSFPTLTINLLTNYIKFFNFVFIMLLNM